MKIRDVLIIEIKDYFECKKDMRTECKYLQLAIRSSIGGNHLVSEYSFPQQTTAQTKCV